MNIWNIVKHSTWWPNKQVTNVLLPLKYNSGFSRGKFYMQIVALFLLGVIEFADIPKNEYATWMLPLQGNTLSWIWIDVRAKNFILKTRTTKKKKKTHFPLADELFRNTRNILKKRKGTSIFLSLARGLQVWIRLKVHFMWEDFVPHTCEDVCCLMWPRKGSQ